MYSPYTLRSEKRCDYHKKIMCCWLSYGHMMMYHAIILRCSSYGHVMIIWIFYDDQLAQIVVSSKSIFVLSTRDDHMRIIWLPSDDLLKNILEGTHYNLNIIYCWLSDHDYLMIMWLSYDFHVIIMWLSCDYHVIIISLSSDDHLQSI